MKRIIKGAIPEKLLRYVETNPNATWDEMSSDNTSGGSQAAQECRNQAIREQKGLCAYCEREISTEDPLRRRIEHFHPKSDRTGNINWGLDWKNMLATCDGGSRSSDEERFAHPLPKSLSCDASKDYMIQTHKIPMVCEGYMLNPLEIPAYPNLFTLHKGTGDISPDEANCARIEIAGNVFETTAQLVESTIQILNLNSSRLTEKRRLVVINIDQNKKRLKAIGITPEKCQQNLLSATVVKNGLRFSQPCVLALELILKPIFNPWIIRGEADNKEKTASVVFTQLSTLNADEESLEAIEDWHY